MEILTFAGFRRQFSYWSELAKVDMKNSRLMSHRIELGAVWMPLKPDLNLF